MWRNNCLEHTDDILDALRRLTETKAQRRKVFRQLHGGVLEDEFDFDLSDPTGRFLGSALLRLLRKVCIYMLAND